MDAKSTQFLLCLAQHVMAGGRSRMALQSAELPQSRLALFSDKMHMANRLADDDPYGCGYLRTAYPLERGQWLSAWNERGCLLTSIRYVFWLSSNMKSKRSRVKKFVRCPVYLIACCWRMAGAVFCRACMGNSRTGRQRRQQRCRVKLSLATGRTQAW